jgi:hypothetical protein
VQEHHRRETAMRVHKLEGEELDSLRVCVKGALTKTATAAVGGLAVGAVVSRKLLPPRGYFISIALSLSMAALSGAATKHVAFGKCTKEFLKQQPAANFPLAAKAREQSVSSRIFASSGLQAACVRFVCVAHYVHCFVCLLRYCRQLAFRVPVASIRGRHACIAAGRFLSPLRAVSFLTFIHLFKLILRRLISGHCGCVRRRRATLLIEPAMFFVFLFVLSLCLCFVWFSTKGGAAALPPHSSVLSSSQLPLSTMAPKSATKKPAATKTPAEGQTASKTPTLKQLYCKVGADGKLAKERSSAAFDMPSFRAAPPKAH